ncbi:MAG: T9SS type A sorting domain-containing protein, partial [Bacteroidota bacterium]
SSNQYRMGYCAISSTYQNVPTYSRTVEVLTHEGGHLLGSRHTHDCVWNGNNTRIDGCGPAAGYNSGTCAAGPVPVSGTIMSYCHLVSGVGINFNNGFGPQPTSTIVNTINNAACLTACSNPCTTPSAPGTIAVGGGIAKVCPGDSRTFSISAVSGATSYNWTPPAGATIVSGQGTTTINVSFGSGFTVEDSVRVAAVNACGASGTSARIVYENNVVTPSVISGVSTSVCASSGIPYSVILDTMATSYTWSFSSTLGVVASGQGTNAIVANFGTGSTSVTLSVTANNACGASNTRTLSISAIPAQPAAISGTATPCANQQGVPYSIAAVANATSYRWLVPSGSRIVDNGVTSTGTSLTTGSTSILVNFKNSAGNVSVRSNNGCGSSAYKSLAITYPCRDASSVLNNLDELSVNPSIVSEQLQLQFLSSSESQLRVLLMDINGRVVSVSNGDLSAGENKIGIDVSMLPQGIYSIQAEFNGVAKVARFIKQ